MATRRASVMMMAALMLGGASATSKCTWFNESKTCDFDPAAYPAVSGSSQYAKIITFMKEEHTCSSQSTSSTCGAQTKCEWLSGKGKCAYTEVWKQSKVMMPDMTGCKSDYVNYFNQIQKSCDTYETEATCNAGPCKWTATPGYSAASVTYTYYYDGEAQRCVAKPNQTPGRCEEVSVKKACGVSFNASKEDDSSYNPNSALTSIYSCPSAAKTNDTALTECLNGAGACSSMTTSALLTLWKKKLNGTFNSTYGSSDEPTMRAAVKECVTTKFCKAYADQMWHLKPLEYDPQCWGKTANQTVCEAEAKCVWIPKIKTNAECKTIDEVKSSLDADDRGTDACIFTKIQKAKGLHGLTAAQLKQLYVTKRTNENACDLGNNAGNACPAANLCKQRNSTHYTCNSSLVATASSKDSSSCEYDDSLASDYTSKNKAEFKVMMGAVTDAVFDVVHSCEGLTTQSTCEAATLSAADKDKFADAEKIAEGTADSAQRMFSQHFLVVVTMVVLAIGQ